MTSSPQEEGVEPGQLQPSPMLLVEEPQIHLTCSCQGPRLVASLVPELARSSVRDLGLCRVTAQTSAASRTEGA